MTSGEQGKEAEFRSGVGAGRGMCQREHPDRGSPKEDLGGEVVFDSDKCDGSYVWLSKRQVADTRNGRNGDFVR